MSARITWTDNEIPSRARQYEIVTSNNARVRLLGIETATPCYKLEVLAANLNAEGMRELGEALIKIADAINEP